MVASPAAAAAAVDSAPAASGSASPIAPDLRTFNLALASLASAGKWRKALDVSAPMRASSSAGGNGGGGVGDIASVSGGISVSSTSSVRGGGGGRGRGRGAGGGRGGERGRGRGGRGAVSPDGALKAVAAGLSADGETYTHLVVACGKGGEPDRCVCVCVAELLRRLHLFCVVLCVVFCVACVFIPEVV